jgi:hypothetical protein
MGFIAIINSNGIQLSDTGHNDAQQNDTLKNDTSVVDSMLQL